MRLACLLSLLCGCTVDANVSGRPLVLPTFDAVFSYQPRDRLLITATDPDQDLCIGVLLGRPLDDGIAGLDLELPPEWAIEMAYRSAPYLGCHERFPQNHRIDQAYAGDGGADWDTTYPELPPAVVDIDMTLSFTTRPYDLELYAEGLRVTPPGTP